MNTDSHENNPVRQAILQARQELERTSAIIDEQRSLGNQVAGPRPNALVSALHDAQGLLHDATPAPDEEAVDQGESESPPPTEADELLADTLFQQAGKMLRHVGRQEAQALGLLRRCTKDIYEVGKVLLQAQQILKTNSRWVASLEKHQIPRSTAWEAIELYRRTGTDTDRIFALTPTDAKTALGIYKERTSRSAETQPGTSSARKPSHPRRGSTPESAAASEEEQEPLLEEPQPEERTPEVTAVSLPNDAFVLTDADQTAVTTFVESAGGWTRAAQVFQAAWNDWHNQEKEGNHAG